MKTWSKVALPRFRLAWAISLVAHAAAGGAFYFLPWREGYPQPAQEPQVAPVVEVAFSLPSAPTEPSARASEPSPPPPEPLDVHPAPPPEPPARPQPRVQPPPPEPRREPSLPQEPPEAPVVVADVLGSPPPEPPPPREAASPPPEPPPEPPPQPPAPEPEAESREHAEEAAAEQSSPARSGVESPVAHSDNPPPAYPPLARRRGYEGVVVVRVRVGSDGRPLRVAVAESCGHAVLDRAAREAVETWRFRPARAAGRAVAAEVEVPIRFRLTQR
ncbi:MAG: energy transducer TonB [Candidatus Brocadiia bacterium]